MTVVSFVRHRRIEKEQREILLQVGTDQGDSCHGSSFKWCDSWTAD
jgi:hypothetical protein